MQEKWVQSLGREDLLEKEMATTPGFLPGNPMDRGAWRATVHGVTRVRHDLATKQPPPSTSVKWEKCVFQNNNSDGYQEKMV